MRSDYDIRFISAEQTLPLRQKVLRPLFTQQECIHPGDSASTTFHQGLFIEEKLVAISTFILESHPEFSAGFPYRLRGMATDAAYQGQGLGLVLLQNGVEYLRKKRCDLLWFNARERAFSFYERLGFKVHGPMFDIIGVPHKVMYKHIIPR